MVSVVLVVESEAQVMSISHRPQQQLTGCVVVLNSGGPISQNDHIARVVRQLLWREYSVGDQGRIAEAA